FGVFMAALEHGLSVPADLSIVGIDDHYLAEVFSLTTVRQDVEAQGEHAVALLLEELAEPGRATRDRDRILPTELVIRSSTELVGDADTPSSGMGSQSSIRSGSRMAAEVTMNSLRGATSLPIRSSKTSSARAAASTVTRRRVRCRGSMVVSASWSASISP